MRVPRLGVMMSAESSYTPCELVLTQRVRYDTGTTLMKSILTLAAGLTLCTLGAKAQNVNYNVNMTAGELAQKQQATALENDPEYQYGLMNCQATFQAFQRHLRDENLARAYAPSPDVVVVQGATRAQQNPATPASTSSRETPTTPAYNQSIAATYNPTPDVVVVGRHSDGSTYRLEGRETQVPAGH